MSVNINYKSKNGDVEKIEIIDGFDFRVDERLADGDVSQLVNYCWQYTIIIEMLNENIKKLEQENYKLKTKIIDLNQEGQKLKIKVGDLEKELIQYKFSLDTTAYYENQISILKSQCVFKRGRKKKKFPPEEAEIIRNIEASVRERASILDSSTRTIQQIDKGTY